MITAAYYLENTTGRDIIRLKDSDLQVKVYDLKHEPFNQVQGRTTFYADQPGRPLAFVTESMPDAAGDLAGALAWYVDHIDVPAINLTINDPRADRSPLRLVL